MALVINANIREVKTQVFGKWFSFKPNQIKSMDDNIAMFLIQDRSEEGFQGLPEICVEDPTSEEAKAAVKQAIASGRERIKHRLQWQIHNLEVSLQKDLGVADLKMDAKTLATPGDLAAYRLMADLQAEETKGGEDTAQEVAKLKEKISGSPDRTKSK